MTQLPESLPPDRIDPDPVNFSPANVDYSEVCARHRRAVEQGEEAYEDPSTGYRVFTAATLWSRGRCCGLGCRHCPFRARAKSS